MRILVCEYGDGLPAASRAEGRAMLAAVLEDFGKLPGHEVATLPGAAGFAQAFRERLRWAEAVLVIAPETRDVLGRLTADVEASGRLLLGSSSAAVRIAADKLVTGRLLAAGSVPTPPVACVGAGDHDWPYPRILKPVDGCGSDSVHLVRSRSQRAAAVRRLGQRSVYLEQPYVRGVPASVSLLVAGGRARALSLNRQFIAEAGGRLRYHGGSLPLAHPMAGRALAVAVAACRLIPGLQGFVGVDVVLTATEVWVIEINPRITTAYVGLRLACPFNLAGALIKAAIRGDLANTCPRLSPGRVVAW